MALEKSVSKVGVRMNDFRDMMAALRDPAVQAWGHRIVKAGEWREHDFAVDPAELHGAIDEPSRFELADGPQLWWQFWQLYGVISIEERRLRLDAQPFRLRLGIFMEEPGAIAREVFGSSIESTLTPPPSEIELARKFPDIRRSAGDVSRRLSGLARTVVSDLLNQRVAELCGELNRISTTWRGNAHASRERLWEIAIITDDAMNILNAPGDKLHMLSIDLLRTVRLAWHFADPKMCRILDLLNERILQGVVLDRIDGPVKGAIVEAHIYAVEILRKTIAEDDGAPPEGGPGGGSGRGPGIARTGPFGKRSIKKMPLKGPVKVRNLLGFQPGHIMAPLPLQMTGCCQMASTSLFMNSRFVSNL